ncbi:MAG: DUF4864 domain-containing protein [Burkholderiaceae bacterium]
MARFVHRRLLDVIAVGLMAGSLLGPPGLLAREASVTQAQKRIAQDADQGADKQAAAKAIEAIVRAQTSAFSRDDGLTAFSFAAPSIQQQFGSATRFMEMVISGYPMIYRARELEFGPLDYQSPGFALQPIGISDVDGVLWIAIYAMMRQPDGQWRIAGVQVKPTGSNQI